MGKPVGRITNDIRALRFQHGRMTQQDLADRVGVTRQTVNAIEGNKYSPSLEVAFRIAYTFDVPSSGSSSIRKSDAVAKRIATMVVSRDLVGFSIRSKTK